MATRPGSVSRGSWRTRGHRLPRCSKNRRSLLARVGMYARLLSVAACGPPRYPGKCTHRYCAERESSRSPPSCSPPPRLNAPNCYCRTIDFWFHQASPNTTLRSIVLFPLVSSRFLSRYIIRLFCPSPHAFVLLIFPPFFYLIFVYLIDFFFISWACQVHAV